MGRNLWSVALLLALLTSPAFAEGKRYAVLVGINEYDHAKLPKLDYAVNDAAKTAEVLNKHGYEVSLLTDETGKIDPALVPVKANVERALAAALKKFQKGDTILIGWAGHGLQFGKECYFCVKDTKPFETQATTMLSLNLVYKQLEETYAGVKLVLIDACRDDGGRGLRGGAEDGLAPPKGVGVLMSCSAGEKASESDELKHGLFFYHVIRGLEGSAQDSDKEVTWDSLRAYVKKQVPREAVKLSGNRTQNPNEIGDLSGQPPTLIRFAKTVSGKEPERAIAPFNAGKAKELQEAWAKHLDLSARPTIDVDGVAIDFALIPPGKFAQGSPESERGFPDEHPAHQVEITKAYYLSVHPVTQEQYEKLSGLPNPSWFAPKGGGKDVVEGMDTRRFPVEKVTWKQAAVFCDTLNAKKSNKPRGWSFALPSEAQWEYACRAGTDTAFWFGNNGDRLNEHDWFEDNADSRTHAVGGKKPNPWGLSDLHGNVAQWCFDWGRPYDKNDQVDPEGSTTGKTKIARGGSWFSDASRARSANRRHLEPDKASDSVGIRLVLRP